MPYRRLPNTDLARLHALQSAIQRAQSADYTEQVLPYKIQSEAQRFLVQFENTVMQSKDNYTSTVNANKQYRHIVQNARMYISHFIQVKKNRSYYTAWTPTNTLCRICPRRNTCLNGERTSLRASRNEWPMVVFLSIIQRLTK